MIGRQAGGAGYRLPLRRTDGGRLLPWLIACLAYIAGLGAAGLLVVGDTVNMAKASLAGGMTLQVPADTSLPRLDTVLAALRQTPGIAGARLLTPAETAQLLAQWLGPAVKIGELPVPRLVDIRVAHENAADFAAMRQHLASIVPDAQLDDHRAWLAAVRGAARRFIGLFAAAVAIALLLMAVATAFSARVDLALQRSAVELLQQLGARDRDIARAVATGLAGAALLGAAAGAAGVVLSVAILDRAGALLQLPAPVATLGIADWRLWGAAIATAIVAGAIVLGSAWLAVQRRLARLP